MTTKKTGRPRLAGGRNQITISLTDDQITRLDAERERLKASGYRVARTAVVRRWLDIGMAADEGASG